MFRMVLFCAVAAFSSALVVESPNGVFKGTICPYVRERDCSVVPELDFQCFPIAFGKCTQNPQTGFKWYFIPQYDNYNQWIRYERYTDPDCLKKDQHWWHNPKDVPQGRPGECVGPIGEDPFNGPMYVEISLDFTPPSPSLP